MAEPFAGNGFFNILAGFPRKRRGKYQFPIELVKFGKVE